MPGVTCPDSLKVLLSTGSSKVAKVVTYTASSYTESGMRPMFWTWTLIDLSVSGSYPTLYTKSLSFSVLSSALQTKFYFVATIFKLVQVGVLLRRNAVGIFISMVAVGGSLLEGRISKVADVGLCTVELLNDNLKDFIVPGVKPPTATFYVDLQTGTPDASWIVTLNDPVTLTVVGFLIKLSVKETFSGFIRLRQASLI